MTQALRPMNRFFPMIYVVDANVRSRRSAATALSSTGLPVRSYGGCDSFLREFDAERYGAVVVSAGEDGECAREVLEKLADMQAPQAVIVLSEQDSASLCRMAFKLGAREFLVRPVKREVLIDSLHQCLRLCTSSLSQSRNLREARERFERLSPREREILGFIVAGLTTREIGHALSLSPRTVEVHRAHLGVKLQAKTVAQLVRQYAPLVESEFT